MNGSSGRVMRWLFWLYVAITVIHIAFVVNHEPFAFDAWNVASDSGAKPATVSRFFGFWHQQYTESNPRIGQPLAYLAYKIAGFAEIGTPLAFLAIVLGGFVLGTGRYPSVRRGRDLAVLAIGIGFLWFASPSLPSYLFCRAYATNYVWVAAVQLWFLVALRMRAGRAPSPLSPIKVAGIAVLGVAAGMGNEHVGPTIILFSFCLAIWTTRRGRRDWFLWAGAFAVLTGYALLFFAPGQGHRYQGLSERYTVVQQILVRGVSGNLGILQTLLFAASPLMILAVAIISTGQLDVRPSEEGRDGQRRALIATLGFLLAGTLITATVFASPLLGPRFYLHAMLLFLAGVMALASAFLDRPRSFAPFVLIAVVSSGYAVAKTVPLYLKLAHNSETRLAALAKAPAGSVYTAAAWPQVVESWWFLGDDLRDQKKQEMVASYFGLHRVWFRGGDLWTTLGITDVKLTMHYDISPSVCLDEVDSLDLKPYVGRDIEGLHHAFVDSITEIQRSVPDAHVHSVALKATFLGTPPPMPRKTIYVARWTEGVLEGYTAGIKRLGRTPARELVLAAELKKSPWEMYVVAVGDEPKKVGLSTDASLHYEPWLTGQYWILACKADYCFVTLSTSHKV